MSGGFELGGKGKFFLDQSIQTFDENHDHDHPIDESAEVSRIDPKWICHQMPVATDSNLRRSDQPLDHVEKECEGAKRCHEVAEEEPKDTALSLTATPPRIEAIAQNMMVFKTLKMLYTYSGHHSARLCLLHPSNRVSHVIAATHLTQSLPQFEDLAQAPRWISTL